MPYKDFYTTRPTDIKPGDVLVCIVTAHVRHDGTVRLYRCGFNYRGEIPQGAPIPYHADGIMRGLFPVLREAGLKPA